MSETSVRAREKVKTRSPELQTLGSHVRVVRFMTFFGRNPATVSELSVS